MTTPSANTTPTTQDRARAWSSYWAGGALHSLAGSFAGNYDGAIGAFWQEVFAQLPQQGRVLDLCCGNSPLGQLLMQSAQAPRVAHLAVVDAARIAPAWPAQLPSDIVARIAVHGETDVAALPFPDAAFDLCISQYGIEYVGQPAFSESGRVLRSGGRLAAVLHHADALPVRIGREETIHIDTLLAADGLYARASTMIEPLSRAATPAGRATLMQDAGANAARAAFNDSLRALQQRIDAAQYPDVMLEQREAVMQLLAQVAQLGEEAGNARLSALRQTLLDAQLRQRELVDFALDEAGIHVLLDAFPGRIEHLQALVFDNGELAGWALVAVRD